MRALIRRQWLAAGAAGFALTLCAIALAISPLVGATSPVLLSRGEMAVTVGADPVCGAMGGVNCDVKQKTCDKSACLAKHYTCHEDQFGLCLQLTGSEQSTTDCAAELKDGNCCAVCGANCTTYLKGTPKNGSCNFQCKAEPITYCGSQLCNTYTCGEEKPDPPKNPDPNDP